MKKLFWPLVSIICFSFILGPSLVFGGETVRVGVYQDEPMVFVELGESKGFFIDVLEEIARREGWDLEYVSGSFTAGLARLRSEEIDILTVVAYSQERDELYDFNREVVLPTWGQIYTRPGVRFESVLDLDGKNVAVVKEDIYYQTFYPKVENFGIEINFIEHKGEDEYFDIFESVVEGSADALLVNRLFGNQHADEYGLLKTPVICCPVGLRYAFPKGRSDHLIERIDHHLSDMKDHFNSVYYQSLQRWFGDETARLIPGWLYWLVLAGLAGILLLVVFVLLLRIQVRTRTAELRDALASKDLLMHELHHRVRNNLQTILGFIALEEVEIKNNQVLVLLDKLICRIHSMALIHKKLCSSGDLQTVLLGEYIGELVVLLRTTLEKPKVNFEVEVEEIKIEMARAIPLGLVINEIVSNAMFHAFEDDSEGTILIKQEFKGKDCVLLLADDGRGLPDSFEKILTDSLSLRLVKQMVESQLQGKIKVETGPTGTSFEITFPNPEL